MAQAGATTGDGGDTVEVTVELPPPRRGRIDFERWRGVVTARTNVQLASPSWIKVERGDVLKVTVEYLARRGSVHFQFGKIVNINSKRGEKCNAKKKW